ncbi:MAG: hypothetical protein WEB53_13305 [Akkermansiaceae bacterium]
MPFHEWFTQFFNPISNTRLHYFALDVCFNPAIVLHAVGKGIAEDADGIAILQGQLGGKGSDERSR